MPVICWIDNMGPSVIIVHVVINGQEEACWSFPDMSFRFV